MEAYFPFNSAVGGSRKWGLLCVRKKRETRRTLLRIFWERWGGGEKRLLLFLHECAQLAFTNFHFSALPPFLTYPWGYISFRCLFCDLTDTSSADVCFLWASFVGGKCSTSFALLHSPEAITKNRNIFSEIWKYSRK